MKKAYKNLLIRIILLAAILWVLFSKVFLIIQAEGNDMFPAVKDGDLMFCYRLQTNYRKDDVVVYTAEGKTRVGRIAALGSDAVMLDDTGTLLVNGTVQSGEILYPTYGGTTQTYPYYVPDGEVFILGDYRTKCKDSRNFGSVPLSDVKGKVITILRRRGL